MLVHPPVRPDRFTYDLAEPWESTYTPREGGGFYRDQRVSHPSTPRSREEIPEGAFEALDAACGIRDLSQVLILPFSVRWTGEKGRKVMTPMSVLALGRGAVGLWTERPRGLAVTIPLEEILCVEDCTILLYGRLSFTSRSQRLTVRYNTVSRRRIEPAVLELRRAIRGPAQVVPPEKAPDPLPFKWERLLQGSLARLEADAPAAFRFSRQPSRRRREAPLAQLLVLNPHELVYLRDPPGSDQRYGVDAFIVSRSRLAGAWPGAGRSRDAGAEWLRGAAPSPLLPPMPVALLEAAEKWMG